jgi:hypothetical protein
MMARGAPQRRRIIRDAKFPKKIPRAAYSDARGSIRDFLPKSSRDVSHFNFEIERLEARLRTEPEGWGRDEIKRSIEALKAFQECYTASRLKALTFTHGPTDLGMELSGVRLNVRLDLGLFETGKDGSAYEGGCVLFVANTDEARKNIEERRKIVAGLIYWALQSKGSQTVVPLPRLCMSLDVFGRTTVKASRAVDRFREGVNASCREAASMWDSVEPPDGYDGPDWR